MELHHRRNANTQSSNEAQPPATNDQQPNPPQNNWLLNKACDFAVELFTTLRPSLKTIIMLKSTGLIFSMVCLFVNRHYAYEAFCKQPIIDSSFTKEFCQYILDANGTENQPPLNPAIDQGLTLSKGLANTDVYISSKLGDVELSFSDLKGRISFSDLDQIEKNDFYGMIEQIVDSARTTKRGIRGMLRAHNNALGGLVKYANKLYAHLSDKRTIVSRLWQKPEPIEVAIVPEQFIADLDELIHTIGIAYNMSQNTESNLGNVVSWKNIIDYYSCLQNRKYPKM
ncbi:unnamed protein product [Adineta ricciae]|uniref:Uncharacterized protein n=1 Tax=Adineta ricciae TaxID=249248 RepID=A0A816DJW9_ADIRI|nr:unnamed protein product [Adineta ricciae]CAF1635188.1 unnamed protein product [Adineta ricciae]